MSLKDFAILILCLLVFAGCFYWMDYVYRDVLAHGVSTLRW